MTSAQSPAQNVSPFAVALLAMATTAVALGSTACVTHASDATSTPTAGRPAVAVTVVEASPAPLTESIDVVGSLTPKFYADVKSELTGVIAAVYVTDWVWVRRGDALARLDSSEIEAG